MRKILPLLIFLSALAGSAQTYTVVTASNVLVDNGSGTAVHPPGGSSLCFLGVNNQGGAITYTPSGGSPVSGTVCQTLTSGGALTGSLQVANGSTASPLGLLFTITVINGSTTYLTIPMVSVSGTLFNYDAFSLQGSQQALGFGFAHLTCSYGARYTSTSLPAGENGQVCNTAGQWQGYPPNPYCAAGNAYQVPQSGGSPFCLPPAISGFGAPSGFCVTNATYYQQDATPGQNFYACIGGGWVHQTGSGGGGTYPPAGLLGKSVGGTAWASSFTPTLCSLNQGAGGIDSSGNASQCELFTYQAATSLAQFSGLVGAFTDSSGNVIEPVWIGFGPVTFSVPIGATQLQLGVNDSVNGDNSGSWTVAANGTNYTVLGTATPWLHTGGINARYPDTVTGATSPTVVPATAGTPLVVSYVSGTVTNGSLGTFDTAGRQGFTDIDPAGPGGYALTVPSISPNPMIAPGDLTIGGVGGYPNRLVPSSGYLHWTGSAYVFDTPTGGGSVLINRTACTGCVADGNLAANTGTDNTSAINACVTAAIAANGVCYIPAGVYRIAAGLTTISVGGTGIVSDNWGFTGSDWSGPSATIFSSSTSATIVTFDGGSSYIAGDHLENIALQRSVVPATGAIGVKMNMAAGAVIKRNFIDSPIGFDITDSPSFSIGIIENNEVAWCYSGIGPGSGPYIGFNMHGGANGFTSMFLQWNGVASACGASPTTYGFEADGVIRDLNMSNNGTALLSYGVYFNGPAGSFQGMDVHVVDQTDDGYRVNGEYINFNGSGNSVMELSGGEASPYSTGSSYGTLITNSRGVSVHNRQYFGQLNAVHAIELAAGAVFNSIVDNVFLLSNNVAVVCNASNENNITGNIYNLSGTSGQFANLTNCSNNTIMANTGYNGNSTAEILLDSSSNNNHYVNLNNVTSSSGISDSGTGNQFSSAGLSGMTSGQVPIAATASTVTSSKAIAGTGSGITTGPTTTTTNDCVKFADTAGTLQDSGSPCGSAASGGGGGGGGNYVNLCASVTLTNASCSSGTISFSAVSSFTISAIPGTFINLIGTIIGYTASGDPTFQIQLNADATQGDYKSSRIIGIPPSTIAAQTDATVGISGGNWMIGDWGGSSSDSGTTTFTIPAYASAQKKAFSSITSNQSVPVVGNYGGSWSTTAITSLKFSAQGGGNLTGSMTLYGTTSIATDASVYNMVTQGGIDNTGATDVSSAISTIIMGYSGTATTPIIFFPAGTYKINAGMNLACTSTKCNGIIIEGAGKSQTIFQSTCTSGYAWWWNSTATTGSYWFGPQMRDLQIADTSGTGACNSLLRTTQVANFIDQNLELDGAQGNDYTTGTVSISNGAAALTGSGTTFTAAMVPGVLRIAGKPQWVCGFTDATHLTLCDNWQQTTAAGASYSLSYGGQAFLMDGGANFVQYGQTYNLTATGNKFGVVGNPSTSGSIGVSRNKFYGGFINGNRIANSMGFALGQYSDSIDTDTAINNVSTCWFADGAHDNKFMGQCEDDGTATVVTTCNGGVASQSCLAGAEITGATGSTTYGNVVDGILTQGLGVGIQVDSSAVSNLNIVNIRAASFSNLVNYNFFGTNGCPTGAVSANIFAYDCNYLQAGVSLGGTPQFRTNTSSNTDIAGFVTLSSGSGTYNFAGTYTSSLVCVASDTTNAANNVKPSATNTTLTLTGTGSDVISYICVGRN